MIINKFGGEIIGNPSLAKLAVERIKEQLSKKQRPLVVVSALFGTTDKLANLSKDFSQKGIEDIISQHLNWMKECGFSEKEAKKDVAVFENNLKNIGKRIKKEKENSALRDEILSLGERTSSFLFAKFLVKNGLMAKRILPENLGIITDENFGDACILEESINRVRECLMGISGILVAPGFIGMSRSGQTTTLGRGGSDTTACLVGAAFSASRVILWKNVPGVLSADPKIVKKAREIRSLSFQEAEEAGRIIHSKALEFAKKGGVSLEIRYIRNPSKKTKIEKRKNFRRGIRIISVKDNLEMFFIKGERMVKPGALFEISRIFAEKKINIVLIRDTKETLYIVVEKNRHNLSEVEREIIEMGYEAKGKRRAMVSAVGNTDWKTVARFNKCLYQGVPRADLGAFPCQDCYRLAAIVAKERANNLAKKLHREFMGV